MSLVVGELIETVESDADRLIDQIREHTLPDDCIRLIDRYEQLEYSRDPYIWKWIHSMTPNIDLPFVEPSRKSDVRSLKLIVTLFITVLDDILEHQRDLPTFQEASTVPFAHRSYSLDRSGVDADYVTFVEFVWNEADQRLEQAPHFRDFYDSFMFDLKQSINAIEYSSLVTRKTELPTLSELLRYESHNMMMFPFSNIDLMHSDGFDRSELATLREAVWHAQELVRIANWISTWERELSQGDFSSGVIVYALREGIISRDQLETIRRGSDTPEFDDVVETIHQEGVEDRLLSRWDSKFLELQSISSEIESVDLTPYVEGTKEVMKYDLASRGLM